MNDAPKSQLGLWDIPLIFAIGILSFAVHEFSHWITGELLGYDLKVGINKAGLVAGEYSSQWHQQLVSISGPVATTLVAVLSLAMVYRFRNVHIFPVVFFALLMRFMALVISIRMPNDEARVSQWLGLGKWTLPFAVSFFLGWLVFLAAEKLQLNWKSWAICFVVSSMAITTVVLTEPHWPVFNPYVELP